MTDRDANNLREFVTDVAQAGYRRLTIALGPQQTNSPKCTRTRPADCVDSRTFDEDISFALNVREIAKQASGPSLDLRFDLLNEGCVLPTYQPVASIVHAYLVRLLREYAARFGTSDMTVSCFSNPHKMKDPWRARVEMLLNTFRDAGVNPSVFDFHLYVHDSSQIPVILGEIKKLISPWNMKLVVGESLYGNAADTAA